MIDNIGKKVTEAVGNIVPFYLYEGAADSYPYAVYFYSPEYHRSKDGVYKITADVTVQVYSDAFDEAYEKADDICDALLAALNADGFKCDINTGSKECVEDVWNVEVVYSITQTV